MSDPESLQVINAELQPVPTGALESIQRAEIDTQIATAHKYPRSIQKFQERARSMALIDEDTAASCIYSRPVGGGKFAEGLSVRAAEIVGASYGNLRVGATIIEQTERYVKARGFAHDLESNYACATEVIESTVKRDGSPYDERMRIVIAKSCLAKARRDATFQVVPKAMFKAIEVDCRKLALGEGQSVSTRRARIVQWITKLAIEPKRVWTILGIAGEADMTDEHFITLTGLKTSITDGEVTIDEAFPKIIPTGNVGSKPASEGLLKEGKTTMELAHEEVKAAMTESPEDREKRFAEGRPLISGAPTAAELLASIIKKGTEINAGKAKIEKTCIGLNLMEPSEKLDKLTAGALANILDSWPDIEGAINEANT